MHYCSDIVCCHPTIVALKAQEVALLRDLLALTHSQLNSHQLLIVLWVVLPKVYSLAGRFQGLSVLFIHLRIRRNIVQVLQVLQCCPQHLPSENNLLLLFTCSVF